MSDGAEPVTDLRDAVRKTVDDAQRAVGADQVAADADQSAADADQTLSDADQSASSADQRSTSIDQLASDRDQSNADRQHAAGVELTPADEQAYEASRDEREAVSVTRQQNRVKRARTAGRRDATAGKRDRITETRGEGGRARDARVVVSRHAIEAWEMSRRAEDAESAESGAKYRGLLEAAPDAMVVVNQAGDIVLLNLQVEKQFGYHRDELVGQPVTTIIPEGFAERLIADDLRSAADALAQQIGTGIELIGRRKDGTEFPIEIMLSPLESALGILVTAAIRNISVRVAAEAERTRLVSAVEQTADSISMHGLDGTVTYVNAAFTAVYGYEPREIVGRYGGLLDSGRHDPAFFAAIRALASAGQAWTGTIVNRRKDGTPIEVEAVISAIHDADGRVASYVQADRDVTREGELERALERDAREREAIETALARIDPAASAEDVAAAACAVINELPGVDSTWAAVLDGVDGAVLAATGQLAPTFARGRPIAASRVEYLCERGSSGAWFEEWRPRSGDGAWAEAVTSTGLLAMAYAPLRSPRGVVGVVGIGSHDPLTARSLVEHVPALATFASILGAQLVPKLEGRRRDAEGKSVIRAVLDASAFGPFFQPIVDLHTGTVVGYEALTRFADGIQPDVRFAAAARAGLGIELETATLQSALAAAAAVLPPEAYLGLNASPALISSGSLRTLFAGLERPMVLEITEHVVIDDYATLRAELAGLGPTVRLAVDDAGAGYASFRHILELAPDLVKLDIGLIRRIDGDPARQALIAGMGYFAVKRKLRLVAEGIETPAELKALRGLAIPYGQGYLLGRPQDGRGPGPWPSKMTLPK
ncbi:MAG: EAL domain-containing protein [Candidatus Limnocylindrales bacterium]